MTGTHFLQLVGYNVRCNLRAEARRYALSYLWWVLEPALHLLILYVVFGIFFGQRENTNYIPFLFCGLVPWFWFSKSVTNGVNSIIEGGGIIKETYIPKFFFPTVSIAQDSISEMFVFLILILLLLASGVYPTSTWLLIPFILTLQLLLIASISYFLAILVPYFHDLKYIVTALLQVVMFGSGTFYDYKIMPPEYQEIFLLNPCALLINMYRDVLIHNQGINFANYFYVFSFAVVLGLAATSLYKKFDRDVPRVLFR